MKKNLVLLGMSGSGKSTIGKILARVTGLDLHDIDKIIEKDCGSKIEAIFENKGEIFLDKLRKITLNVLKLSNNIIALGGGAFLNEKIRSKVLKNNHSIWLNWENQTLISRLYKSKKRPITYNLKRKDLNNLINKRSKIYSMANYKINCDKLSKNEIINKILKIYEK